MTIKTLAVLRAHLEEAMAWLDAGQRGDPNGAKAYQASKCVGDALAIVKRAQEPRKPRPDKFNPRDVTILGGDPSL